jgi:hypothetical protein
LGFQAGINDWVMSRPSMILEMTHGDFVVADALAQVAQFAGVLTSFARNPPRATCHAMTECSR